MQYPMSILSTNTGRVTSVAFSSRFSNVIQVRNGCKMDMTLVDVIINLRELIYAMR